MCRCVFILGLMRTLENARLPCQSSISFGNGTHVGTYMGLSCCSMRTPNHTLLAVWISIVVCKLYTRGHVRTCSGVSMYRGFDSPILKNTRFFVFFVLFVFCLVRPTQQGHGPQAQPQQLRFRRKHRLPRGARAAADGEVLGLRFGLG